jgi:hypothetical protein
VLCRYLSGGAGEDNEKPESGFPVPGQGVSAGACQNRNRSANYAATTLDGFLTVAEADMCCASHQQERGGFALKGSRIVFM